MSQVNSTLIPPSPPPPCATEISLVWEIFYDRSVAHSLVHGGAEQDALSSEVSASGAEERAILVQEPQGQEQAAEDGFVWGRVTATASISRRLVNFVK